MENKKQTILITGAYGFVGQNLSLALKNNYNLWALDIVEKPTDTYTRFFTWDDLNNIPKVDAIIHLAGKAHDTKNQTDRQVYFDINTTLTQKIYDWFLNSEAEKFIFFSSVKAAADKVEGILTEDVVPCPKGPYGESKIKAEEYLLKSQESRTKNKEQRTKIKEDREENKEQGEETRNTKPEMQKSYILRPCMIHGPGNKGNLNLLYNFVKKNIPWPLGAYENKRSFTAIDNLTYIIQQLLEKDIESATYNVCDDESISTNELISLFSQALNKPVKIWKINKILIQFTAKLGSLFHLPLNEERLHKLTENYVVSNSKIKKQLGITELPVKANEGILKTIKNFIN